MPDLAVDRKVEIMPSSMLRNPKGVVKMRMPHATLNMQPIFCYNCGADCGYVPELPENCNFAFALCDDCAISPIGRAMAEAQFMGTLMEPDMAFGQKVTEAQLEADGRVLEYREIASALKDDTHYLSKLVSERDSYLKRSRA